MADKKSFILYVERKKEINMLSNEQCGILFKAIFEYVDTGEVLEIDDLAVKLMFSVFKAQIDRESEKWVEVRKRRSEAGKKGMAARWSNNKGKQAITNDNKAKQTITNITDNVNVNDNVLSLSKDNDNTSSVSEKQKAPPKKKYGEYKHVLLTDTQYEKLIGDYGEQTVKEYIDKIDQWIQLKGKSPYKDFSLAIRNWIKRDGTPEKEDINDKYAGTRAMQGII